MKYIRKSNNGQGYNMCNVITALMWGVKTRNELMNEADVCKEVLTHTLKTLHENGLVYRHSYKKDSEMREDGTFKCGPPSVLWAWNTTPYAHTDFQRN